MKTWQEAKKVPVRTRYGIIEVPVEDCLMPNGGFYAALKMEDGMHETLIKRTVYVSKCKCGETDIRDSNPPKERLCKCGRWAPYEEQSSISPEYKAAKPK